MVPKDIDFTRIDEENFAIVEQGCVEYYSMKDHVPTPCGRNNTGILTTEYEEFIKFKKLGLKACEVEAIIREAGVKAIRESFLKKNN